MDLKSLRKMETLPASAQAKPRNDDEVLLVLVKLRRGFSRPSYVSPRAQISEDIFSAQIRAGDLQQLERDPAVESLSLSRTMPVIE